MSTAQHTPAQVLCLQCALNIDESTVGRDGLIAARWPEGKSLVKRGELRDGWGRKGVKVYRITDVGRSAIAKVAKEPQP